MDNQGFRERKLKIVISGASGFIGTSLSRALREKGHDVIKLVRKKNCGDSEIYWDPALDYLEPSKLENIDVVINLSGQNIASKRWTPQVKAELRESRVKSTKLLASTLGRLKNPPKLFLSASSIGFYGHRSSNVVDESSEPGTGFLSSLTREWELSTWAAEAIGIRVNHLRIGMVLGKDGGALEKIVPPIRFFMGAILGKGDQYLSWISERDLVRAVIFLIENPQPTGPFNLVSPSPVSNETFMKTIASVLKRPMWLRLPHKLISLLFGEMGEALFLESMPIMPKKLLGAGFSFADADLRSTIKDIFKK